MFLGVSFKEFLYSCDGFVIKEGPFAGKNIFRLDLRKEAEVLKKLYPDCEQIILERHLPNQIIIKHERRRPLARIKLLSPRSTDYYCIDKAGILFLCKDMKLPLIYGLEGRLVRPKAGQECNEAILRETLDFVGSLKEDRELWQWLSLREINLRNPANIVLITAWNNKIKVGSFYSFNETQAVLVKLLRQAHLDLEDVEYIELRFKDSIVKYKPR